MAKQSSVNLDITNNPDGFDISGGTTSRKLTVTGADITLEGSGSATITFPTTSTTLAGLGIAQTFTATQGFAAGFTASGATFSGNISAPNIVNSVNGGTGAVSVTGSGAILTTVSGNTTTFGARLASSSVTGVASFNNEFVVSALGAVGLTSNYVVSVNGGTGAVSVTGSGAILTTVSGNTTTFGARLASSSVTGVASFNTNDFNVATTGHVSLVSGVVKTTQANTYTSNLQSFNAGLSAANVQVSGGFTANSSSFSVSTATIDLTSTTASLRGFNTDGYLRVRSQDSDAAIPTQQEIVLDGGDSDLGELGRITVRADIVAIDTFSSLGTFQVTGSQRLSGSLNCSGAAGISGGASITGGLTCFGYINLGGAAATDSVIRCVSANSLTIDANSASGVVKLGTNTTQFNPFGSSTDMGNSSTPWKTLYIQSVTGCTFSGNVDYNRNAISNPTIENYSEPFAYQVRKELNTGKSYDTYYVDLTYGNTFFLDLAADNSGTLGNYASGAAKPSVFVKGDGNAVFNCTSGLTGATLSNVSGTVAVGQFIYAPGLTDTGVTATAYNAGTGALTLSKAAIATVSTQYAAFATPNTVALGMVASPNLSTASTKSPARVHTFTLMVEGTAGGAITWNTTANTYGRFKWPSGTAPTLTATRGKYDVFSFLSYDYGVTWLAFNAGQNF